MEGPKFIANFDAVAVTVAQDLFELSFPSGVVAVLHEVKIVQSSDAGDAESEQLRYQIKRGVGSTSGSGGSTQTPLKMVTASAISSVTSVELNNTTQATAGGGSLTVLVSDAENIHNGWYYLPRPELRILFGSDEELYISLPAAPADSLTMSGYIIWQEQGGSYSHNVLGE